LVAGLGNRTGLPIILRHGTEAHPNAYSRGVGVLRLDGESRNARRREQGEECQSSGQGDQYRGGDYVSVRLA
jgi:hypothetical protein